MRIRGIPAPGINFTAGWLTFALPSSMLAAPCKVNIINSIITKPALMMLAGLPHPPPAVIAASPRSTYWPPRSCAAAIARARSSACLRGAPTAAGVCFRLSHGCATSAHAAWSHLNADSLRGSATCTSAKTCFVHLQCWLPTRAVHAALRWWCGPRERPTVHEQCENWGTWAGLRA